MEATELNRDQSFVMDHHGVRVAAFPGCLLRRANIRIPSVSTIV